MKEISTSTYSFRRLREHDCLYVDKTKYIYKMLQASGGQFFFSRPRRFGKSLTVSTLEAIFKGERELFHGLYLDSTDYDWPVHPVIHIDFTRCTMDTLDTLSRSLCLQLLNISQEYGITFTEDLDNAPILFSKLILQLYEKTGQGVVILIDEYDKPILEHMTTAADAETFRSFSESFYQVIKGMDAYEHFVFLTGVTKFAKVSIFSKLNNLTDITADPEYATMLGYTQEEFEQAFAEHLDHLLATGVRSLNKQPLNRTQLLAEIKKWYDGFCFTDGAPTVYNPVSVGKFFQGHGRFRNYWFATGTPTFLIDILRKQQLTLADLDGAVVSDIDFETFDVARLAEGQATNEQIFQIMLQAGYLTLDTEQASGAMFMYTLRFPNYEIETSFTDQLSRAYHPRLTFSNYLYQLIQAIQGGDTQAFIDWLKEYLANIPYDIQIAQEKYYQSLVYGVLLLCGADMQTEVRTNKGRIDAVLKAPNHLYIIEFKLNQSAETGLAQIEEKAYTERYRLQAREKHQQLHQLTINFSYDKDVRNITDWKESIDA